MAKVLVVPDNSCEFVAHRVTSAAGEETLCLLKLEDHFVFGEKIPGKCSKICSHGYSARTQSFKLKFPLRVL